MTKEQRESMIEALLHERMGYERRLKRAEKEEDAEAADAAKARVGQVNAELKKLGAAASKPSARSEKRPRSRGQTKR